MPDGSNTATLRPVNAVQGDRPVDVTFWGSDGPMLKNTYETRPTVEQARWDVRDAIRKGMKHAKDHQCKTEIWQRDNLIFQIDRNGELRGKNGHTLAEQQYFDAQDEAARNLVAAAGMDPSTYVREHYSNYIGGPSRPDLGGD